MKRIIVLCLICIGVFSVLKVESKPKKDRRTKAIVETNYGTMVFALYDDTPLHKENFIKLAKDGFYDGLLFHRVIEDFMIQGGDPDSRNAEAGKMLGAGGLDYNIPAEISRTHINKRGALAAARQGNAMNPDKESSACQFFVVQGDSVDDQMLDQVQKRIEYSRVQDIRIGIYKQHSEELDSLVKADRKEFHNRISELDKEFDEIASKGEPFTYTEEQRAAYKSLGGYPSLDMQYTIFGELIEGFDVLEKIQQVEKDQNDRPVEGVVMTIKIKKSWF